MVAGRCQARVPALRTQRQAPILALLNADGSGERALTEADGSRCSRPTGRTTANRSWVRAASVRPIGTPPAFSRCLTIRARAGFAYRLGSEEEPLQPEVLAGSALDRLSRARPDVQRNIDGLRDSGCRRRLAGDDGRRRFRRQAALGTDGRVLYYVSDRDGVKNVWGRRFDNTSGSPAGDAFPVTSFRSPQFLISPHSVQMDIAITSTHLLIPMSESRGDIWMLDQVDR